MWPSWHGDMGHARLPSRSPRHQSPNPDEISRAARRSVVVKHKHQRLHKYLSPISSHFSSDLLVVGHERVSAMAAGTFTTCGAQPSLSAYHAPKGSPPKSKNKNYPEMVLQSSEKQSFKQMMNRTLALLASLQSP